MIRKVNLKGDGIFNHENKIKTFIMDLFVNDCIKFVEILFIKIRMIVTSMYGKTK